MTSSTTLKLICMVFVLVILVAPHAEATYEYDAPSPLTFLFTTTLTALCYPYLKTGRPDGLFFFKPLCCLCLEALKDLTYSSDASLRDVCCVVQNQQEYYDIPDKNSISIIKFCNITTDYIITRTTDCNKLSLSS